MRILLVEDDPVIAELIRQGLEEARFRVDTRADGRSGLAAAMAEDYDAVILDVLLPQMDGWTVLRTLRERRRTCPVLMLTALDSVPDRVRGLESGADDYLPKPFDFSELLARVRSLLRRDKVHKSRVIKVADLEIDTLSRVVRRASKEISLTAREYTLLEALALNEGRVLTREMIQDRVWMDEESYSNTVNVHITYLRKKIDAGHDVRLIHTVHGMGYMLRVPEDSG